MNRRREGRQKLILRALSVFRTTGRTGEARENAFFSGYLKTNSFTLTLHRTNRPLLVQSIKPRTVITLLPQFPFSLDLAPANYCLFPKMEKPS
jgi:hypothetical protein